jgi:hypothetical protein
MEPLVREALAFPAGICFATYADESLTLYLVSGLVIKIRDVDQAAYEGFRNSILLSSTDSIRLDMALRWPSFSNTLDPEHPNYDRAWSNYSGEYPP